MKKYKWYLLLPLLLVVFTLIAGNCVTINVPQTQGQHAAGEGQSQTAPSTQGGTPPVINDFSASPANITTGGSATLSWQVTGANTVNISPGIGNVAMSGSAAVSPSAGTAYMLTAINSSGSQTAVTQVSVEAASPPPSSPSASLPVINYFEAYPVNILAGSIVGMTWSVSNATSVTLSPGIGAVSPSENFTVSPGITTTYTLTATNTAGWRTKSITVTVSTIKLPLNIPLRQK
ncbi:MAG: hypothetical protein NTY79_02035 [Chloroflexi bacterium]|nr:hypothetical protein [Chloroflexota bacterium]